MEEESLQELLNQLTKSTDKSKSYKCLLCIRRHVDRKSNVKKLREYGGLKTIVQCLSKKNINILDVTLSILGNCCLEYESAKEVISYNVIKALGDILRTCKQDSIYGRVCRMVGNISQFNTLAKYFNTNQSRIITNIIALLVSSKDEQSEITETTQLMAIRALRIIFHRPYGPYILKLMEAENVVRTISALIVHYADDWVQKQEHHVLLKACIRCLSDLSSSLTSYVSINQLLAGGEGIKSLVKILPINPYSIVKIITQLSPYATTRSELEIPSLCKTITEQIKIDQNFEDGNWPGDYVNALCLLCLKHQINCDEVRQAGGLSVLHEVLRHDPDKDLRFESVILKALKAYIYDEAACTYLANSGLIETLVNKLDNTNNSNENIFNSSHEFTKRGYCRKNRQMHFSYKRQRSTYEMSVAKDSYMQFLHGIPRSPTRSLSDGSGTSSTSASPSPSNDLELSDDSEDYSPVCSDNDDIEDGSISNSTENPSNSGSFSFSFPLDDEPMAEEEYVNCNCSEEELAQTIEPKNFLAILSILTALSRIKPPVPELGKPHTLLTLLKYGFSDRYPRRAILKFLHSLLGTSAYLLPLMQTNFIQTLHSLTEMQHSIDCSLCYQKRRIGLYLMLKLTSLTECGGVRGDIAHHLLRSDSNTKMKILLSVPYIVKNRRTLQKFMLNCDGLNILTRLMKDDSEVQKQSIKVLCVLASQNLGIISPFCPTSSDILIVPEYKFDDEASATMVTFLLDDGSEVQADRTFLSEKSDFFNALLTGQFKESKEEVIQLKNVFNKPFTLLLSLLYLELPHLVIKNINVDVETLLNMISLADRYMLVDLCVYLTRTVEQYKITTKSVPSIYKWSLESGTNLLRIESIAHALVGNSTDSERFDMFNALFELGCSEHLIGDIRTLLVRYLNVYDM